MRFALTASFVALLATFAMAVAPQKSVIMSWPNDTPDSVVQAAKQAIIDAKGTITHEYNIIKGFACTGPASVFEFVSTMNNDHKPEIEEDGVVYTQNN
ncbi:hypothetical protein HBI56_217240 [Parastagonospora nodorum]|uniref:Inhibitor I9 domain-containing protein n=2 Tax=Phaeosphaeria nodorum (strain SN15 / ATCC MYA-4574 / FGSC 10173) TaxID=321614 RepID=A0A7U2F0K4_PHANO|nr:hypothetical protein SNOG_01218 [Parastagonospora nodorum SN15]KAH3908465.1 hypothetical protein HBH56_175390 [Parastagonospora nodorum]EAT90867.1 hypothetical protein SNOG_01218 [Parastagonospora nodorum SN15]KAH3926233.1 hypothetical protein HBH54_167770 [Parastagonospora nodorum]KAH3955649.1 hypothetical protein HBH53_000590 [Parastagonospora nodorum]KAH3965589.1 hypothetical protein HBH52_204430 [Parastagonospora nodorum]